MEEDAKTAEIAARADSVEASACAFRKKGGPGASASAGATESEDGKEQRMRIRTNQIFAHYPTRSYSGYLPPK